MKLRYPALCLSVLAAMSATSGTALAKPVKDQVYKITILHTNDHHGRFCAIATANTAWPHART